MKYLPIYEFNELSEAAKQKAIDKLRYINVDCFEWYEFIFQDFRERAAEKGLNIKYNEIQFSGFACQGDGASFTCNDIDIEKLLKALNVTFKSEVLKKIFCDNVSIGIRRINNLYSHKYTVSCYCDYTELTYRSIIRDYIYTRIDNYLYNKSQELEEKLEALKNKLCNTLYDELEKEYDYQTSNEVVTEAILANEYYFFNDGKIA